MNSKVIAITPAPRGLPIPPHGEGASGLARDPRGRGLRDLRISVTDRCNFRCVYCMPKDVFADDYAFLPHGELLSFEEIVRLAGIFRGHGIEKIRLTGGEPLLRRNIEELVRQLATALPGIDLTLTTNGSALKAKARALREAGLNRITVSLDALDDGIFKSMNDVDFPVAKVLEAIDAAAEAGLAPVKVNMVVKRGTNDREVLAMAKRFRGTGHIVRFIEYMDVGSTNGWRMDEVVPSAEIVAMIGREFALEPIGANHPGEVAERWRYADGRGEIGVISSVTQAFCASCNRARLSTDGQLFTCLFAEQGYDLKSMIRSGRTDAEVSAAIGAIWRQRADNYSEVRTAETARERKVEMSFIGG
jgi:cyclic pyranopterin phosphate synthase